MAIDYNAIGNRVRYYRKRMNITQQKLAELSNQEPSNISHIERGATKLGLPTIINIANALNVSVDELLCDNLVKSRAIFEKEMEDLLADCSDYELKVLVNTVKSFKNGFRKIIIDNNENNK